MAITEYAERIDGRGPHVDSNGVLHPYIQRILNDFIDAQNANTAALNGEIETVGGEVTTVAATPVLVSAPSTAFAEERAVIDTATITWDFGTDGEASASLAFAVTAAGQALLDDADASAQRATLGLGTIATLDAVTNAYTPSNVTTSRSFDADTVTIAELADVVGTLIEGFQSNSVVG